jgi:hypothetical protein
MTVCVYFVFSPGGCKCMRGLCGPEVYLYCITDERWQLFILITHNAHNYNTSLLLYHIMSSLCHVILSSLIISSLSLLHTLYPTDTARLPRVHTAPPPHGRLTHLHLRTLCMGRQANDVITTHSTQFHCRWLTDLALPSR